MAILSDASLSPRWEPNDVGRFRWEGPQRVWPHNCEPPQNVDGSLHCVSKHTILHTSQCQLSHASSRSNETPCAGLSECSKYGRPGLCLNRDTPSRAMKMHAELPSALQVRDEIDQEKGSRPADMPWRGGFNRMIDLFVHWCPLWTRRP